MKKYDSYKDSCIEWIGEIPSHWEVFRLCYLGFFSSSGIDKKINPDENLVKIINFTDIYNNASKKLNNSFNYMVVSTTENKINEHLVKKGDLIFLPSSETYEDLGTCAIVDEELENVSYSYHVIRLRFNVNLEHNFKKYLTNNYPVLNQFSSNGQGTTRKIIGRNVFRNIKVVVPSFKEQTTISNYLDHKTTQIDHLIAKKEQLIQLLEEERVAVINQAVTKGLDPTVPMKDSGIEWLGEIPEHWGHSSLKWYSKIYSGGTPSKDIEEYWIQGTIPWLNSGCVNQWDITEVSEYITEDAYKNSSAKWIPSKSLVIALAGQGKTKGMLAQVQFETTCNQSLGVIVPNEKINNRFLQYWLKNNYQNIRSLGGGDKRDGLNLVMIGGVPIPILTLNEQEIIAEYLDNKNLDFDSIISKTKQEIELLKEYKTALISEVVTGKVDVRNKKMN